MIPTYNCAEWLAQTLESVLAQAPDQREMQIEVVDDCSDDHPESAVATVGRGRVDIIRQPVNLGITCNFTACIQRARGKYVHILHGDDLALPGFYRSVEATFDEDPECDAVFVGAADIDPEGNVIVESRMEGPGIAAPGRLEAALFEWNPVRAPAVAVRRRLYERIGGFHPDLRYCADWDMWKRVSVYGCVSFVPEVLVGYRVHSGSDTARLAGTAGQLREIMRAIRIARRYPTRRPARGYSDHPYWVVAQSAGAAARKAAQAGALRSAADLAMVSAEARIRRYVDRSVTCLCDDRVTR
jgi:glycosyltransferase involved in cell wall biosynthesis